MQNNGAAVSTFAGHYMYDLYARRKFTCELPSDVIKALHTEYGVALETAKSEVFKIVPTATASNFGSFIRTRGVPQGLNVDVSIATMIEDAVKIRQ